MITTLAVLRVDADSQELALASLHPGTRLEQVLAATGWPLRLRPTITETPAPTTAELDRLRRFDPHGFWTERGDA